MKNNKIRILFLIVLFFLISKTYSYSQSGDEKRISNKEQFEIINLICEEYDKIYLFPEITSKIRDSLTCKFTEGKYSKINLANEFAAQLERISFLLQKINMLLFFIVPVLQKNWRILQETIGLIRRLIALGKTILALKN